MQRTPIEWTHWSVNPFKMRMPDGTLINACVHKSDGCRNCYAEGIVGRFWRKEWGEFPGYTAALLKLGTPVLVEEELQAVLRLSIRIAEGKADPHVNKIFWNDMTDEFLDFWPDTFIDKCFTARALTPNLVHQVLTKRPDRLCAYLLKKQLEWTDWGVSEYADEIALDSVFNKGEIYPHLKTAGWWIDYDYDEDGGKDGWRTYYGGAIPLPNVWFGTSVEDQKTADERIPLLLQTPAAVRWISAEPLLGPVDLARCFARDWTLRGHDHPTERTTGIDWVVVGGESGPKARPMHPDWARSLRDQCVAAGAPFFFKQWGEWGRTKDLTREQRDRAKPIVIFPDGHTEETLRHGAGRNEGAAVSWRVGKKIAGRLLDGREWNQFPNEAAKAASA